MKNETEYTKIIESKRIFGIFTSEGVLRAAKEIASIEAKAFANWIRDNAVFHGNDKYILLDDAISLHSAPVYNTDQMFEYYRTYSNKETINRRQKNILE